MCPILLELLLQQGALLSGLAQLPPQLPNHLVLGLQPAVQQEHLVPHPLQEPQLLPVAGEGALSPAERMETELGMCPVVAGGAG